MLDRAQREARVVDPASWPLQTSGEFFWQLPRWLGTLKAYPSYWKKEKKIGKKYVKTYLAEMPITSFFFFSPKGKNWRSSKLSMTLISTVVLKKLELVRSFKTKFHICNRYCFFFNPIPENNLNNVLKYFLNNIIYLEILLSLCFSLRLISF